jgi:hypothetical protein
MKPIQKYVLIVLILFLPEVSTGQNWMMARQYVSLAIDSLIHFNWPITGKLIGFNISHPEYDELFEEFTIQFSGTISCSKLDFPLRAGEETDIVFESGEMTVGLKGGEAIIESEDGEITNLELPDLSKAVYIFNEVGRDISLSLSADDKSFETYTLSAGEFYYFPCFHSDYAFIKIPGIKEGKETVSVHFKLENAKGYKVTFDKVRSEFEVYPDERMDIEDIKE